MTTKPGITARFLGAVKIGRLYLSHRKGLVAATTQTQAAAINLDRSINHILTVAVSGDGVKLPLFEESRIVIVANDGANTCRIYTKETSGVTIGAIAGSTGITLAAGQIAVFYGTTAGRWDVVVSVSTGTYTGTFDGVVGGGTPAAGSFTTLAASSTLNVTGVSTVAAVNGTSLAASAYFIRSVGNALTAVGTNRATGLQLAKEINNVTTAATGTGVILPVGVIGMKIEVFADSGIAGAALQVYASGSETIDTVAGATGVVLTKAKRCVYEFVAANTWISAQMGVISA